MTSSSANAVDSPFTQRWARAGALVLAMLGAVVAVVLMVLPLYTTSTTYHWNPSDDSQSGALALDRSWPAHMVVDAELNCGATRRAFFSTSGFKLYCRDGAVWAKSGEAKLGPIDGTPGDAIRFTFNGESGTAALSNRTAKTWTSATLAFEDYPIVRDLYSPSPKRFDLSVTIETRPSALESDFRRWLLAGVAIALAVGSAFLARGRRPEEPLRHTDTPLRKFWPQHLAVLLGLSAGALAVPMFYDDGWVIQRVTQFLDVGYLGDFYYHSNGWLPQGYLTEALLGILVSADASYTLLRAIVVGILWATWFVLVAAAIRITGSRGHTTVWLAGAVFVAIAAVFGTSLRAESWVGLFTAVALYFIARYNATGSATHLFGAGASAGLAVATHQSGFIAFVALIAAAVYIMMARNWRISIELVTVVVAVLAVTLAVFFIGYDLPTIAEGARDFSDAAYSNRLDEFFRATQISGNAISGARRFATVLALAIVALVIVAIRQVPDELRRMLVIVAVSPLGLLLTSSKWGWHIAVLAIPAAMLVLVAFDTRRGSSDWARPRFAVLLPLVTLLAGISLAQFGSWGTIDYSVLSWERFAERVAGPDTQWWWLIGALAMGLAGNAFDRARDSRPNTAVWGMMTAAALVMIPSSASFAWAYSDTYLTSGREGLGWTVLGHNVDQITSANPRSCGSFGDDGRFTASVLPLDAQTGRGNVAIQLDRDSLDGFQFTRIDGWRTNPADKSAISTPTFGVPAGTTTSDHFALWYNTGENPFPFGGTISVLANTTGGVVNVRDVEVGEQVDKWQWRKIEFTVPFGTESVRIVTAISAPYPVKISSPVQDIRQTAASVLSTGTALVPPNLLPSIPCAELPAARDGLFPQTPFLVSIDSRPDFILRFHPHHRISLTQLEEVREGVPTISTVAYDSALGLVVETDQSPSAR